jgi:hypothetical protein
MSRNFSDSQRTEWTLQKCSSDAEGREAMARSVVEGRLSKAAAARQFNTMPTTVAKWVAGPNSASQVCGDRGFAPAAIHGQADRRRSRDIARNRQPDLAALVPQQAVGLGAGRSRAVLSAGNIPANLVLKLVESRLFSVDIYHQVLLSWTAILIVTELRENVRRLAVRQNAVTRIIWSGLESSMRDLSA